LTGISKIEIVDAVLSAFLLTLMLKLARMDRKDRLEFCNICTNRAFSPENGTICSLTNQPATFEGTCGDFLNDEKEERFVKIQQKSMQSDRNKKVRNAIIVLFVIGVINAIMGFVEAFIIDGHEILYGIIDWVVALIFIGLGILAFYSPYISLIIGLSFYLLLIVLMFVGEPTSLIRGIIWKFGVVYLLIRGIQHAKSAEKKKVHEEELLDNLR
jgi:hypothetical protein